MLQAKKYKRIVVKVGTNVLTRDNGRLDIDRIFELTSQIGAAKKQGVDIILVSSGAVGAGLALIQPPSSMNRVDRRQLLAAIGQPRLLQIYLEFFKNMDLHVAQILATKEDFRDRHHYLHMRNCFRTLLKEQVIPIVNENDVIAVDELMFTDNDELATLVASMIEADALFILTNVDGVFNGDPDDPNSNVIPIVDHDTEIKDVLRSRKKSAFGRGGMQTKYRMSKQLADMGIAVHIANGKKQNIILDLMDGSPLGTHFIAQEKISPVKKWIAHQNSNPQGQVIINKGAQSALQDLNMATSLLPIGIEAINGDFEKGDVIQIKNGKDHIIGLGMAQYDSELAKSFMGQQGEKPLIHYDYLFVTRTEP